MCPTPRSQNEAGLRYASSSSRLALRGVRENVDRLRPFLAVGFLAVRQIGVVAYDNHETWLLCPDLALVWAGVSPQPYYCG